MTVGGEKIQNNESPEKYEKRIRDEVNKKNKDDKESQDKRVFQKTKWYWATTVALLVISSLLSCFIRYLAPVIIVFCLAIASYIITQLKFKKNDSLVAEETIRTIKKREQKLLEDVSNYSSNYEKKIFENLSKKLNALRLMPITEKELFGGKNED